MLASEGLEPKKIRKCKTESASFTASFPREQWGQLTFWFHGHASQAWRLLCRKTFLWDLWDWVLGERYLNAPPWSLWSFSSNRGRLASQGNDFNRHIGVRMETVHYCKIVETDTWGIQRIRAWIKPRALLAQRAHGTDDNLGCSWAGVGGQIWDRGSCVSHGSVPSALSLA